jgi:hypothetical protein
MKLGEKQNPLVGTWRNGKYLLKLGFSTLYLLGYLPLLLGSGICMIGAVTGNLGKIC